MPLVDPGKKAPAFALKDQDGHTHSLADYAGQPLVLYFYPKDDTPGCTAETCSFRDNLPRFKKSKAAVLGVSILESPKSTACGRRNRATDANTWASRARRTSSILTARLHSAGTM